MKVVLLGLLLLFSAQLPAEIRSSGKCVVEQLGTWVDLGTLNQIHFNSDCSFRFDGAQCSVSGEFYSGRTSKGPLMLWNKTLPTNSTCLSQGEHSCTFQLDKNSLTLNCAPQRPLRFVKQLRRSVASFKELKGQSKTLFLLQNYKSDDLKTHLEKLSDESVLEATTALGYNYFYGGRGFEKDYSEALYWNQLAASRGSHIAKVLLGTHYLYGLGVSKDLSRAEKWFISAAKEKDAVPQKALAGMYLMGASGVNNRQKAIFWLTQAIKLGDRQAKEFLDSLNPQEVKDLKMFCALFELHQTNQKPQSKNQPVIESKSPPPTELPQRVETRVQEKLPESKAVSEEGREIKIAVAESIHEKNEPVPFEPSRCLTAMPASSSHSQTKPQTASKLFWMGGGVTQLGLDSSSTTFNHWQLLMSLKTVPFSLWGGLNLEGYFDYAMPLNSQEKSLSYSKIEGRLHYDLQVSEGFLLKPSFSYLRLQFEDAITRLGIVGGQIALGMQSELKLDENWAFQLSAMTLASGRGSLVSGTQTLNMSAIQSNYTLNLFLQKKEMNASPYGFGVQFQRLSLLGAQQAPVVLSQYSGQFFYNF